MANQYKKYQGYDRLEIVDARTFEDVLADDYNQSFTTGEGERDDEFKRYIGHDRLMEYEGRELPSDIKDTRRVRYGPKEPVHIGGPWYWAGWDVYFLTKGTIMVEDNG